jgi:uncharacterized protein (DUF1330 family)
VSGTSLPAFYIAEVLVTNPDDFSPYAAKVPATIEKYGGRYLVRGGRIEGLEGEPPKRLIVTAFPSAADAQKWYDSPEYSEIKPIRQRSATTRAFIVEGVRE